jgi:hypothetical protein
MKPLHEYWLRWAEVLRRYHLHELTAILLEAGRPFALLAAQTLHFSRGLIANDHLTALALTLEEDDDTQAFASLLLGGKTS